MCLYGSCSRSIIDDMADEMMDSVRSYTYVYIENRNDIENPFYIPSCTNILPAP